MGIVPMVPTKIERHLNTERPPECTRRRMKPFMDVCKCWWCLRLNELIQETMQKEVPV